QRAERVKDRPANPELRIALELHLLPVIELCERIDQPHHSSRDQVIQLDMLRQSLMNAPCNITHRGQMLQQQPVAIISHTALKCILSAGSVSGKRLEERPNLRHHSRQLRPVVEQRLSLGEPAALRRPMQYRYVHLISRSHRSFVISL